MATKKRCFVISPIGDEESDIRREADALLWIAKNALEKYNFEVIRVDQIARSTVITNEIIQLIQDAELCLIILTGENPNVFYEAGRRHETGKPFIQLIKKGERLPFDVAGIRTIIYDDIQSLPSAAKVVEQIQKFVDEFEKSGYGTSGTGASISTIAAALDRIERKVGQLLSMSIPGTIHGEHPDGIEFEIVKNPRETFITAIAEGNLHRAASLLPRLEQLIGPSEELIAAAGILSTQGYEPAMEMVYRMLTEHWETILTEGMDSVQAGITSIVRFYVLTDREEEGINRCKPLIDKTLQLPDITNELRAYLLNQLQMLYYGAKQYEEAAEVIEQVIELNPNEPAYIYNASTIYDRMGLHKKSVEMVDRYMSMGTDDADHLSRAVRVYVKSNRINDAKKAFQTLRNIDRSKARYLLFGEPDLRRALGV